MSNDAHDRNENNFNYDNLEGKVTVFGKLFDRDFYLLSNPDILVAGIDPLKHFVEYGWREGRTFDPMFDINQYLVSDIFKQDGSFGRFCEFFIENKSRLSKATDIIDGSQDYTEINNDSKPSLSFSEHEYKVIEPHFDSKFYLRVNQDVSSLGLNPLAHFLEYGWREKRNPTQAFSVESYLEANTDVLDAGINPFYHYIVAGKDEGRLLRRPYSEERKVIENSESMMVRAEKYKQHTISSEEINDSILIYIFSQIIKSKSIQKAVVSISHDSYVTNFGGIQNCIRDEQSLLNLNNICYIHISPSSPSLAYNQSPKSEYNLNLNLDGQYIGNISVSNFLKSIEILKKNEFKLYLVIHSILGHNTNSLSKIYRMVAPLKTSFWVHDCSTLCSNYALLRNDIEFCWAPDIDSASCSICVYGAERLSHIDSVKSLFREIQPLILFPSEAIKELWCAKSSYTFSEMLVRPHGEMIFSKELVPAVRKSKLNVAFVGMASSHKGWHVFSELATVFDKDERYEFYHFGTNKSWHSNIEFVETSVGLENRNLMVERLIKNDIDIVVQWSLCFETFSFSTCESILSGAFVVAREDSGNSAYLINAYSSGILLTDKQDLFKYFQDNAPFEDIYNYQRSTRKRGTLNLDNSSLVEIYA
ncbi:hypothetical protein [Methylobacterium goesingense]|uniref:Uncharacterized protein n=1 Tax=Methylobacterium goesingense TaxID=243690 RepID=A0ABV2LDI9_9HYPH|nr:hypothetical protein [Methylobacterium goesingense]GJD76677.1 hypothetical protein CFIICLFH_4935 [Methylobacterium goesingense]